MTAVILFLEEDADLSLEPEKVADNPHKNMMVNLIKLTRDKVKFLPIIQNLDWNIEEGKQWIGFEGAV